MSFDLTLFAANSSGIGEQRKLGSDLLQKAANDLLTTKFN
jgi:hypothetical protein